MKISPFAKQAIKEEPVAPAMPQLIRSRFQIVLDDMDVIYKRFDHARQALLSLVSEAEKGMKFANQFRVDLTQAIEETGEPVEPQEEQRVDDGQV
jgi:hypothetical protein